MFDEARLHREVAVPMIELARTIGSLLDAGEGDVFNNRMERRRLSVPAKNSVKTPETLRETVGTEQTNELEAGTRRARSARSVRARDGRR
jgi:hypothetical protein